MKQPVLVTGGAGYIGSQTCKALAKAGYLPITYDNLSTGHAYAVKWGPLVQGDLTDQKKLTETIQTYRPSAVLHFAADAIVIESVKYPAKYYRNNLAGTLSLLEVMRDTNLRHLIFSSTCATYGNPLFTPISEEHQQIPINPYGRTKLFAEQMMCDFSIYGINPIFLRYFNAAGADLETEIGEHHNPETHLIPETILAALGIIPLISIYGTDFPTPDGSAIRDYTHVIDLAEAHVLALQYAMAENKSDVFNLGTGTGTSVLEIIEAVGKHCGKSVPLELGKRRGGEPAQLVADSQKAQKILGWTPKYSTLPVIIESAWKWHQLLAEKEPILRSAMQKLEEQRCSISPIS